jgi:hypothetical protein
VAYNPDDGFIYTMVNGVFARYTTAGVPDAAVLPQPGVNLQGLTYIGVDQFIGIADNTLHQYDRLANDWTELTTTLTQQFPDAGLAFDNGVLYAITSNSDQLFTIGLTSPYTIAQVGPRGSSNGGGLATSCKPSSIKLYVDMRVCF